LGVFFFSADIYVLFYVFPAKALERFMQDLLDEAAKETQARGARKVTVHHLCVLSFFLSPLYISATDFHVARKRAILATPSLDFLKDLVESIQDPIEPGESKPRKKRKTKKEKEQEKAAADEAAESAATAATKEEDGDESAKMEDDDGKMEDEDDEDYDDE
jgi:hypothetical protein